MVNPGAFNGSRKVFLLSEKANYSTAVRSGFTNDVLAEIQRRFLKRFPIDLPHDQEPSAEHLASIDDDAADPEPEQPDEANLSPEDYATAIKQLEKRRESITKLRNQIKRWFAYQYMKDNDIDPKESGAHNPLM